MKPTWKNRFISLLKVLGMMLLLLLIGVVIIFSIWNASFVSWTGFGDYTTPAGEFIRGKTLWDWMELLVIPLSLLIGGYFLNRSERDLERQISENRTKEDRQLADDRAKLEREIANDRQQEAALQAYLDRMAELLLEKKLLTTEVEEVRNVARTRTLTILRGLDPLRKGIVVGFLHEAGLIHKENPVVELSGADLSGAKLGFMTLKLVNLAGSDLSDAILLYSNLSSSDLTTVNLSNADLSGAFLSGVELLSSALNDANLSKANLMGASLNGAFLSGADLSEANLIGADLSFVNLNSTNFREAQIENANFSFADLSGAYIKIEQLSTAKSLKGATMPDGTIHD